MAFGAAVPIVVGTGFPTVAQPVRDLYRRKAARITASACRWFKTAISAHRGAGLGLAPRADAVPDGAACGALLVVDADKVALKCEPYLGTVPR